MTGRTPGSPRTPGSGRKRGSLDRAQRSLLTEKMAGDIMKVYTKLGGVAWLLKFAQENPAEFMRQGLSRLFPQPIKEDPDTLVQQQFNIEGNSTEIARRIAFALAMGLDAQGKDVVEHDDVPYSRLERDDPSPQELLRDPAPDPEREAWAQTVALSPEEKLNQMSLDEHTNMRAFAEQPAPAVQSKGRVPVRLRNPKNRDDLL